MSTRPFNSAAASGVRERRSRVSSTFALDEVPSTSDMQPLTFPPAAATWSTELPLGRSAGSSPLKTDPLG